MTEKEQVAKTSAILGGTLALFKLVIGFLSGSLALLSEGIHSTLDFVVTLGTWFSVKTADIPADREHHYGHGKVEYFSVFIEGTLILVAGIIIIGKATYSLFFPHIIHDLLIGAIIIGATGLVNGVLGYYMINKGKILPSITIEADGRHLLTDMVTSSGLVIGLLLIHFTGILVLDGVLSIAVGGYIILTGYKLIRRSVGGLMDEADFLVVADVVKILNDQRKEEWIDVHNFRAQKYGNELHIDCHVTLPNYFDLNRVHEEVSLIDKLINEKVTKTELFIHADPCLPYCCHYCSMPNCPIRSEPKTEHIEWTMDRVIRNKKHFE